MSESMNSGAGQPVLSPTDEVIVAGLVLGKKYAEIAKLIGRSERTVRRAAARPEIEDAVDNGRRALASEVSGSVYSLVDKAITVIGTALENPDPALRMKAADLTVRTFFRFNENTELRATVQALTAEVEQYRSAKKGKGSR